MYTECSWVRRDRKNGISLHLPGRCKGTTNTFQYLCLSVSEFFTLPGKNHQRLLNIWDLRMLLCNFNAMMQYIFFFFWAQSCKVTTDAYWFMLVALKDKAYYLFMCLYRSLNCKKEFSASFTHCLWPLSDHNFLCHPIHFYLFFGFIWRLQVLRKSLVLGCILYNTLSSNPWLEVLLCLWYITQ